MQTVNPGGISILQMQNHFILVFPKLTIQEHYSIVEKKLFYRGRKRKLLGLEIDLFNSYITEASEISKQFELMTYAIIYIESILFRSYV